MRQAFAGVAGYGKECSLRAGPFLAVLLGLTSPARFARVSSPIRLRPHRMLNAQSDQKLFNTAFCKTAGEWSGAAGVSAGHSLHLPQMTCAFVVGAGS